MPIAPSRAGLRKNAMFWLVFVSRPPAVAVLKLAVVMRARRAIFSLFIFKFTCDILYIMCNAFFYLFPRNIASPVSCFRLYSRVLFLAYRIVCLGEAEYDAQCLKIK